MMVRFLFLLSCVLFMTACEDCTAPTDAGFDASVPEPNDAGSSDAGEDPETPTDGGTGTICDENTEGVGDACAGMRGAPECGFILCCVEAAGCEPGQITFCFDLGPNSCGMCGDLDESAGRVGDSCGEFGCGVVECAEDGSATVCVGDHPRNACDGCADLGTEDLPGTPCSECMTGELTCSRSQDEYICVDGRAPTNRCGGCDRCVLATASMDERFGGSYIKSGTEIVIEDVGDGTTRLVFEPLIEGPGANALPYASVYLSFDGTISGATALTPLFAADTLEFLADPARQYEVSVPDISIFTHVLIYESNFIQDTISIGELTFTDAVELVPPDPVDTVDAGTPVTDAGQ